MTQWGDGAVAGRVPSFPATTVLVALMNARMAKVRKGKRDAYYKPFVALGKQMIFGCEEWRSLSAAAREVYILVKAKYNGHNNGQIRLYYSEIRKFKGLKQNKSIGRAIKELETKGWIRRTKVGGLYRYFNEYELTGQHDKLIRT